MWQQHWPWKIFENDNANCFQMSCATHFSQWHLQAKWSSQAAIWLGHVFRLYLMFFHTTLQVFDWLPGRWIGSKLWQITVCFCQFYLIPIQNPERFTWEPLYNNMGLFVCGLSTAEWLSICATLWKSIKYGSQLNKRQDVRVRSCLDYKTWNLSLNKVWELSSCKMSENLFSWTDESKFKTILPFCDISSQELVKLRIPSKITNSKFHNVFFHFHLMHLCPFQSSSKSWFSSCLSCSDPSISSSFPGQSPQSADVKGLILKDCHFIRWHSYKSWERVGTPRWDKMGQTKAQIILKKI